MKTSLALLVPLIFLSTHTCFAADKDKPDRSVPPANSSSPAKLQSVRVRFVPGSAPMKGESNYEGASWSALEENAVLGKGVLWLQAHAGIRDKFPVANKAGVKFFEVILAEGDDEHIVLEISSKEGSKKINLARDKPSHVQMAGIKYELLYPSVSVGAAPHEKPTTNKAMLMVICRQ